MRAQVLTHTDPNHWKMSLETLSIPSPKAGEILIKGSGCGVCHTDLHVIKGEVGFPIPAVMGHEISGTVVGIGSNNNNNNNGKKSSIQLGDKVVSPFIMPCGHCHHCIGGKEEICDTFFSLNRLKGVLYDGFTRLFRPNNNNKPSPIHMYSMGGLAEYCVVPDTAVFPINPSLSSPPSSSSSSISSSIPLPDLSILGCSIFTAYGAIKNSAQLRVGESIAVIGTGGVGQNCLQLAKIFGGDPIIAIDIDDNKLEAMKNMGATHIINAKKQNVIDTIKLITGGKGVDVCIEALGRSDTFSQSIQAVADGGRAIMVGIAPAGMMASIEITRLVRREIKIIGSYGAKARIDMPEIIKLVTNNKLKVSESITKRYSLENADQAYRDLNDGKIIGRAIIDMTK